MIARVLAEKNIPVHYIESITLDTTEGDRKYPRATMLFKDETVRPFVGVSKIPMSAITNMCKKFLKYNGDIVDQDKVDIRLGEKKRKKEREDERKRERKENRKRIENNNRQSEQRNKIMNSLNGEKTQNNSKSDSFNHS